MRRALVLVRVAVIVLGFTLLAGGPALAHDCSSQSDCEQTTGYISGISVIGGIIAIITGILGTQLGGGLAGAVSGATGGATAPTGPSGGGGVAVAEPEPEVPWDELIGATEPPGGAAAPPEALAGDEPEIPWDELLGGGPVEPEPVDLGEPVDELLGEPTGTGEDDPLEGEPGIDELVPIDELLAPTEEEGPVEAGTGDGGTEPGETGEPGEKGEKPPDKVKPPILEATETGTDVAGQIKDAADKAKEFGEEVGDAVDKAKDVMGVIGGGVSDKTRETVGDALDRIGDAAEGVKGYAEKAGEIAEQVKDVGEKAGEYMNALNDNLEKTEQLGLSGQSQDFLGWWRVTIKAAGELTEKFVDGITSPVTKLLGEKYGEKAQDLLHDAVPIKEFGDELSKLPTSAAEHVVNAQQRDQVTENVNLVPKGDAGYIELDDLYPGRKWP